MWLVNLWFSIFSSLLFFLSAGFGHRRDYWRCRISQWNQARRIKHTASLGFQLTSIASASTTTTRILCCFVWNVGTHWTWTMNSWKKFHIAGILIICVYQKHVSHEASQHQSFNYNTIFTGKQALQHVHIEPAHQKLQFFSAAARGPQHGWDQQLKAE